jgi:hypothetical protein
MGLGAGGSSTFKLWGGVDPEASGSSTEGDGCVIVAVADELSDFGRLALTFAIWK